ncbi:MAG TPA: IS3 family transposase, partial [Anaerovoracaceae bacterium]|nr:IS3 family transposase [Anaerovoracaceae bacterium]
QYHGGQSVALLCAEYGIPRSTIYSWISQHRKLKSLNNAEISYRNYYDLKRKYDKLKEKLEVIKAAECSLSAPLKEKLEALERLYGHYSVYVLCESLDVSRGTFYNHIFRRKKTAWYDIRREDLREQVKTVFDESKQRFGSRRIRAILAERGIKISPEYVAGLMREMGLQSIGRNSKREYEKQIGLTNRQNKLQQQFDVSEPNRVWVSDTTHFKVKEKHYYICVILDLFSRKVVAHKISTKHSTYLITSAFKRAFEDRGHPQQLMFHSDQGTQYTSKAFRRLLYVNKVVQSFSRSGRPHDNAVAEAFFSALKKEELYRINFKAEREFYESVDNYIVFFNTSRPHATLSYKTPDQFEEMYYKKQKKVSK